MDLFAVEVVADSSGEFCGNGLRFPTVEAAAEYAKDLFCRWTAVKTWRVVLPCGWGRLKTVMAVKS